MRRKLIAIGILACASFAQVWSAGAESSVTDEQIQEEDFSFETPLRVYSQQHISGLVVIYYDVKGDTAPELRVELNALGPMDMKGQRSDSLTRWEIDWYWPTKDGSPVFEETELTRRLSVAFPRWLPPKDADPRLVERWRKFSLAMARHELGHIKPVISSYEGLRAEIIQAAKEDAHLSAEEANALVKKYIEKMRAADDHYDIKTARGKTQGATFP